MSYDLRFAGSTIPSAPVRAAVFAVLRDKMLRWKDGDDYLQVDLWTADEDGTSVEPEEPKTINRVDIHVSTTAFGVPWKVINLAVRVADAVTAATQWRAFDPQRDEHLDTFDHPWRAEQQPAAQQLGSMVVDAKRITIHTSPYVGEPATWVWSRETGALTCQAGGPKTPTWTALDGVRSPSGKWLAQLGTDRRLIWIAFGKGKKAKLTAPSKPRIWDGIRGRLLEGVKESGRKVQQLLFLDEDRLLASYNDGRICLFDLTRKAAIVSLALLDGGRWAAVGHDGAWDASPGLSAVQWAWNTDARAYRHVVVLDPAARRPGLLAGLC